MEITIKLNDADPGEATKLLSIMSILRGESALVSMSDVRPVGAPIGMAGIPEFIKEHSAKPAEPVAKVLETAAKAKHAEAAKVEAVPVIEEDFVEGVAKHSEYDETIDLALEILGPAVTKKVLLAAGHVDDKKQMLSPKDPYPSVPTQLKIIGDLKRKLEVATAPKQEEPAQSAAVNNVVDFPKVEAKPMTDKEFFDFAVAFGEKHGVKKVVEISKTVGFINSDGKAKHFKTAPVGLREKILELCAEHEYEASAMVAE